MRLFSLINLIHYSGYMRLEGSLEPRLDVVNCRSLEEQCVIHPWPLSGSLIFDPTADSSTLYQVSLLAGHLTINLAPPLTHTIFSTLNSAVLMPYVICNDTSFPIRLVFAFRLKQFIHCNSCFFKLSCSG